MNRFPINHSALGEVLNFMQKCLIMNVPLNSCKDSPVIVICGCAKDLRHKGLDVLLNAMILNVATY